MKRLLLLAGLALLLLPGTAADAYQWYHVVIDTVDHPVYEIQFGDGGCYAGTEAGVFRGYGLAGGWEGMGLEYPGLGAYSILRREGTGWLKQTINESLLEGATGVAVGNLWDRGYPDVVVAAKELSDCVVWYENPLPSPVTLYWTRREVDPEAYGAREVALADLDRDGDLDIAAALRDESKIVWYENTAIGPGDTWPRYDVGILGGPRGVFVADMNDDHRLDIVAGGMDVNTVMWFEAPEDPTGLWTPHCVDDSLGGVKGVFAHDIDGDGDLDIVAAGRDADDVVWYEHGDPSDPDDWTKHYIDDNLPGAVSAWCGDLVGDEAPEIAVTAKHAGWVVVYEQPQESGDLWTRTVIDDDLSEACPISAGDIDGDGRTDIVAAGREAGVVAWYRTPQEAGLAWQKSVVDNAAGHSMGVATGDLDNDGDVDIVATACDEGLVSVYWNDLRDIYCAFSEGSGQCESDGIYRWHDTTREWVPSWWCPRPFFVREHPLVPDVFFCGNHDGFFTSTDLVDWYEMGEWILPDTVSCSWFHPWDSNVFVVGTNRGMYRTADFGMHWEQVNDEVPPFLTADIVTGWMPAPTFVFASLGIGSYSDGVFRSDDMGEDWQRILTTPRPTDLLQDYERSDATRVVMFVGSAEDGIYRVDHNGYITGSLNTGLPNLAIHRMRYDPYIDTPAIFGCTEGGLYECMLLEPTGVEPESQAIDQPCRTWPNPWREGVAFSLTDLASGEPVKLRVFDVVGREVWSCEQRTARAGTWNLHWNGRDADGRVLPSGVYLYRIELAERTYSGKMVRLK